MMKKIKNIAVIHPTFAYNGGAENLILWTLNEWKKLGVSSTVYTRKIRYDSDINQKYADLSLNPFIFSKTKKYILDELTEFDAILIENFPATVFFGLTKKLAQNKNITLPKTFWYCHEPSVRLYGSDEKTYRKKMKTLDPFARWSINLDKQGVAKIDKVFANSIRTANQIESVYGKKADVIYPGVPIEKTSWRKEQAKYFFYIGRIEKPKNLESALLAFKNMLEKTNRRDIKFVIAGKGSYEENIKEYIKNIGISENVKMTGFISEDKKNEYIRQSYALVSVSRKEPFGLTAVEAFSEGCVCIISKYSGASEIVSDGKNAILVEPENINEIENAMSLLIKNEKRLQIMRKNAYKVFESGKFSISTHAKTLLQSINNYI